LTEKLSAIYFFYSDWLGSNTRARMSHVQRDVYLTLLFRSLSEQPAGTLPSTDEELARLGDVNLDTWQDIKAPILAKFESDSNGRIFNPRMMREVKYALAKRAAGSKGGTAKAKRTHKKAHA
jgi:uncharacterized protein YdaU (DUF1376 family)